MLPFRIKIFLGVLYIECGCPPTKAQNSTQNKQIFYKLFPEQILKTWHLSCVGLPHTFLRCVHVSSILIENKQPNKRNTMNVPLYDQNIICLSPREHDRIVSFSAASEMVCLHLQKTRKKYLKSDFLIFCRLQSLGETATLLCLLKADRFVLKLNLYGQGHIEPNFHNNELIKCY